MRQKTIIIVLIVALALSLGYIALDKYQARQQQKQLDVFQQGAQYGYEQTVIQLFQQAITCQSVPINVENDTINVIAVECLPKDK